MKLPMLLVLLALMVPLRSEGGEGQAAQAAALKSWREGIREIQRQKLWRVVVLDVALSPDDPGSLVVTVNAEWSSTSEARRRDVLSTYHKLWIEKNERCASAPCRVVVRAPLPRGR